MSAVYLREFGKEILLSEIYTNSVLWRYVSDTIRPYTLEVQHKGLLSKLKVRVSIKRFPSPRWKDFNTHLRIVKVKVPYKDTLWDTTYSYVGRWEVFLPPKSDIFFAGTYGKEPIFTLEGPTSGVLVFVAPLNYDDSLRFKYGEGFLENPFYRQEVCSQSRPGHLDLYIVSAEEYENAKRGFPFSSIDRLLGITYGCFFVRLPSGRYAFILNNRSNEAMNVVVRVVQAKLIPIILTRYRTIEKPVR